MGKGGTSAEYDAVGTVDKADIFFWEDPSVIRSSVVILGEAWKHPLCDLISPDFHESTRPGCLLLFNNSHPMRARVVQQLRVSE